MKFYTIQNETHLLESKDTTIFLNNIPLVFEQCYCFNHIFKNIDETGRILSNLCTSVLDDKNSSILVLSTLSTMDQNLYNLLLLIEMYQKEFGKLCAHYELDCDIYLQSIFFDLSLEHDLNCTTSRPSQRIIPVLSQITSNEQLKQKLNTIRLTQCNKFGQYEFILTHQYNAIRFETKFYLLLVPDHNRPNTFVQEAYLMVTQIRNNVALSTSVSFYQRLRDCIQSTDSSWFFFLQANAYGLPAVAQLAGCDNYYSTAYKSDVFRAQLQADALEDQYVELVNDYEELYVSKIQQLRTKQMLYITQIIDQFNKQEQTRRDELEFNQFDVNYSSPVEISETTGTIRSDSINQTKINVNQSQVNVIQQRRIMHQLEQKLRNLSSYSRKEKESMLQQQAVLTQTFKEKLEAQKLVLSGTFAGSKVEKSPFKSQKFNFQTDYDGYGEPREICEQQLLVYQGIHSKSKQKLIIGSHDVREFRKYAGTSLFNPTNYRTSFYNQQLSQTGFQLCTDGDWAGLLSKHGLFIFRAEQAEAMIQMIKNE